eukprot:scaffold99636_cov17-Tisochrysis_lutea.AAC.1
MPRSEPAQPYTCSCAPIGPADPTAATCTFSSYLLLQPSVAPSAESADSGCYVLCSELANALPGAPGCSKLPACMHTAATVCR